MLIKKDKDFLKNYLEDSSNLKGGYVEEVALPESIEELSILLKEANSKKIPVTVSGGGTGTTGSRIPFGGIAISLEKLNRILEISKEGMYASLQAGVLVDDLKKDCDSKGLFYTSHPTEGTASVGGTIATNASGARSFKYGPTRDYVRRLKMVLPSGDVLDIRRGDERLFRGDSRIRLGGGREIVIPLPLYRMPDVKSSAGYFAKDGMDLIDLFIGQEGTLSVIAEMEVGLVAKPAKIFSSFIFFKTEEDAWSFAGEARDISIGSRACGRSSPAIDALSIEYFDSNALGLLRDKNPNVPENAKSAIFFEQEASGKNEDALMEEWLKLMARHNASPDDTWVAMNEKDSARFSQFRYAIPEAVNDIIRRKGIQKLSTDIAVPDDKFPEMMRLYTDSLRRCNIEYVIFGHIGESHVHVNILPGSEEELKKAKEIALAFIRKGVSLCGTVSAEHGIGKIKHKFLEEMYGSSGILEMARIKKALDPNCILGLDNIFPREILKLV